MKDGAAVVNDLGDGDPRLSDPRLRSEKLIRRSNGAHKTATGLTPAILLPEARSRMRDLGTAVPTSATDRPHSRAPEPPEPTKGEEGPSQPDRDTTGKAAAASPAKSGVEKAVVKTPAAAETLATLGSSSGGKEATAIAATDQPDPVEQRPPTAPPAEKNASDTLVSASTGDDSAKDTGPATAGPALDTPRGEDPAAEGASTSLGSNAKGRAEPPSNATPIAGALGLEQPNVSDTTGLETARTSAAAEAAGAPPELPRPISDLATMEEASGTASASAPPATALPSAGDEAHSMAGSLTGSCRLRSPCDEPSSKSQRRDSGGAFLDEAVPEPSAKTPVTIIYTRRVVRGHFSDFGVKIQQVDCAWSTVVDAPGNEHILNNSSRDQIVIKRLRDCKCETLSPPEADPLVTLGMERATEDMLACRRHLRTNDPLNCIPAL